MKVILALTSVGVLLGGPAQAQNPLDLDSYIATIREQGITESGKNQIMTAVSIRIGQSMLTFDEDVQTGRFVPTFRSTSCPLPGADPAVTARLQAEFATAREAEFNALKPIADADGSGFVSSEEGLAFRAVFEFGSLAESAVDRYGYSIAAICRASGLDEATAEARLSMLDELGKRVVAAGLKPFPTIVRE